MDAERQAEKATESPQPVPGASVPFGSTVTILFSDIRRFTDYTEQYGDEAAYRILQEHNAIMRKQIEAFGGQVVKTQGDSFMVSFTTARGAILCAIASQRAIADTDQNKKDTTIAVGIGINTGEPIQEGGDFFGGMVNLAARICAAAGPGQILIAETTRYVAGRIEAVDYIDRGLHELKGFQEPQRLLEVRWRRPEAQAGAAGAAPATEADEAALAAAVQSAIGVLNRVLAITHLDDQAFRPLLECQAKATDLRLTLSRVASDRHDFNVQRVKEAILPFENFMTLVGEGDTLSEDRWAQLEAGVARTFGRPLVTAVARRRLAGAAAAAEKREPEQPAAKKPEPPPGPRVSVVQAPSLPPADSRGEAVRWWAGAYAVWSQWKLSGMGWAHAVRAELAKYPHLLSVPIRESAEHDEGRLAGGYFLLLEHAENQSPGFLRSALDRAIGLAGGSLEADALGPTLYRVLVEAGRLRETYAALVRDIIGISVPNPGLWADAGVLEHEDATAVITRPTSAVGDTEEQVARLTELKERLDDRRFTVTVQPLTTRLFYVKPGELKTPRDVEVRLAAGGKPSDRAWYLTLKTSLLVRSEPRLLPAEGVSLPGLGRENAGAWLAIFNAEPDQVETYELTMSVRPPRTPAPRVSPFSPPARRPR